MLSLGLCCDECLVFSRCEAPIQTTSVGVCLLLLAAWHRQIGDFGKQRSTAQKMVVPSNPNIIDCVWCACMKSKFALLFQVLFSFHEIGTKVLEAVFSIAFPQKKFFKQKPDIFYYDVTYGWYVSYKNHKTCSILEFGSYGHKKVIKNVCALKWLKKNRKYKALFQ